MGIGDGHSGGGLCGMGIIFGGAGLWWLFRLNGENRIVAVLGRRLSKWQAEGRDVEGHAPRPCATATWTVQRQAHMVKTVDARLLRTSKLDDGKLFDARRPPVQREPPPSRATACGAAIIPKFEKNHSSASAQPQMGTMKAGAPRCAPAFEGAGVKSGAGPVIHHLRVRRDAAGVLNLGLERLGPPPARALRWVLVGMGMYDRPQGGHGDEHQPAGNDSRLQHHLGLEI